MLTEVVFSVLVIGFVLGGVGGFGVTAGAHRLWSHKAYKAKTPLRIILALCYSVAGQVITGVLVRPVGTLLSCNPWSKRLFTALSWV